jgi:hypothetical protein
MTEQAMSLLRRRMIEDMTIRKFAPKTQHDWQTLHTRKRQEEGDHLSMASPCCAHCRP